MLVCLRVFLPILIAPLVPWVMDPSYPALVPCHENTTQGSNELPCYYSVVLFGLEVGLSCMQRLYMQLAWYYCLTGIQWINFTELARTCLTRLFWSVETHLRWENHPQESIHKMDLNKPATGSSAHKEKAAEFPPRTLRRHISSQNQATRTAQ